jgi:DNA-binding NtrC family response regulator/tetratricopeptide (TPR) repeat protein
VLLEALKGRSPRIEAIRTQVAQVLARQTGARRLPPVLILGETGTGKGLLARAFHQAGPRRDEPFVDINCAAIPETLLEAELFGYERGAFTDARHAKSGLFQTAHGGTLFLDEIGLLPASLQSKLLTVLEDRVVRRLGSTRAEPVDVMLVAATSVELRRAVADGRFREDLYHRLAVITLELPPLRARGTDILALAEHFLARACADYGLSPRALTPDARDVLLAYRWPGNVRELANAMERVALLSDRDEITTAMLDFLIPNEAVDPADAGPVAEAGFLESTLRARIEAALRASGANIHRTAAALGISRNTLRARMDKYGLRHPHAAGPRRPRPVPASGPTVAPSALPQWDRRHLSFLRVKLLASSTVDVGRALEMVGEKVRTFGGWIEEASPTGVIAVFGLDPVDNAPSHAALAALAIQNTAARAHTAGRDGGVVSAIHCADHLVAHRDSRPVIGVDGKAATWSILERMVAADASGAIVVSRPVVPFLVRRFALQRVQPSDLDAWLVLRVEEVGAGWTATRFVGRTSELNALRHAASRAEQRHGQIVAVVGEAGVGKSRLIHEAVQPLKDWLVLSSAGVPFMKGTPYFPVVELLKSLCHIEDTDTASEVRQRVARAQPRDADRSVLAPILDLLRVLPVEDAFRDVDGTQRRKRTHHAVRQMFLDASMAQPLCLIIEDLHWIDSETQEVLDNLVNSITGSRVLLLVNYRPEYQHAWGSKTYYSQVRLDALSVESAGEFLDVLLGPDVGLEPLKQMLRRRGNPFFLEETVRTLVETTALEGARGAYRLVRPVHRLEIPATVQAILAARIDRLPPDDKRLLQSAAVVGKDVPLVLLEAIADLPEDAVQAGLARLQAAEFLYETSLFPEHGYTFKHALTHEVAYGSLLQERRRGLHARVVEAIECLYADRLAEQVERLGHHALRSEDWRRAVTYLRQSGTKAVSRSAYREGEVFFRQALDVLRRLPESREGLEEGIDLRFDLRVALGGQERTGEILEILREAEAVATALGDRRRLGWVLAYRANMHVLRGAPALGLELAERALAIAAEVNDLALEVTASVALGQACAVLGDYRRGLKVFERLETRLDGDRARQHFGMTGLPAVIASGLAGRCLFELGEFAAAGDHLRRATTLAEAVDEPYSRAMAYVHVADMHARLGEGDEALALAERARALAEAVGVSFLALPWVLGAAWRLKGRAAESAALLERAREDERAALGTPRPRTLLGLAETHLALDRLDEAARVGAEGLELARVHGARDQVGRALHLLGVVAARRTPPAAEEAEARYREAVGVAEALGMRPLVAHCHLGLGTLYRRTGDRAKAQEHLTTATAMYREMDMGFWLAQAEAALKGG